jgi:hypothetical protein
MFIPDPDLDFLPIPDPDPGVKKAPDPGSESATLVEMAGQVAVRRITHTDSASSHVRYLTSQCSGF